ncbi:biliverdin-producing heme oxygenase [Silvibacterium sp.]|uniref:biliverdin-producing heme oxygenase n=1 Tax=Silvibacterium sp. TaxID=1964179 RepID=UPI0039E553AE
MNTEKKAVSPILAALREGTAQAHRDLESGLSLGHAGLTLPDYIRTLQLFHAFVTEWENIGEQHCPEAFREFFAGRRRAALLEEDLRFFSAAALEAHPSLSHLRTSASFWGAMYVMEGSTLGGQVISRQLETNLGFSNRNGYSYFYGHGSETGNKWREFVSVLTAESASLPENEIVDGARAQFEAFRVFFAAAAPAVA